MDFNQIILNIKHWILSSNEFNDMNILFKEETNYDNIKVISIDIDSEDKLGLIIIYEDFHLYFDFISKNDKQMKSYNWSEKYKDLEEIKMKILNSIKQ